MTTREEYLKFITAMEEMMEFQGEAKDEPEGSRYIKISETLWKSILEQLKDYVRVGEFNPWYI